MNKTLKIALILFSLTLIITGCSKEEVVNESKTMNEAFEVFKINLESSEYTLEIVDEDNGIISYKMYVISETSYAVYVENEDATYYSQCNIDGETTFRENGELAEGESSCLEETPEYFTELYDEIATNIESYENLIEEEDSRFVLKSDDGLEISISKDSKKLAVVGAYEFDKFSITFGKVSLPY